MNLSKKETSLFMAQVQLDHITDPEEKITVLKSLGQSWPNLAAFSTLELDKFATISDWYHFAIVDLTEVEGFKSEPEWIADRLGISKYEVELAIARLLRLGLLRKSETYQLKKVKDCRIDSVSSQAIQKFHSQMIKKAELSIKSQSFEQRDISGITLSVDPSKLDEVKRRIREFRAEINELLSTGKKKKVYQLNVQFFQLDKI